MIREGDLRVTSQRCDIRPVATDSAWARYAELKRRDWQERVTRLGLGDLPHVGEGLIAANRAKVPPVRYWLAVRDGVACGFVSSLDGIDQMGQVEDLYVDDGHRRQGIGATLVGHAITDLRGRGARVVMLAAEADDTPKGMYARMGFRPIGTVRKYTRDVS
jgi:ribosomal protein S18 acetylase RimI-like enzyme